MVEVNFVDLASFSISLLLHEKVFVSKSLFLKPVVKVLEFAFSFGWFETRLIQVVKCWHIRIFFINRLSFHFSVRVASAFFFFILLYWVLILILMKVGVEFRVKLLTDKIFILFINLLVTNFLIQLTHYSFGLQKLLL